MAGVNAGRHRPRRRDDRPDPFYLSSRWKLLREAVLRRDGYQCQLSRRMGRTVQADTVHHIFPRELYPEYEWEPWNLVSLSWGTHNTLHDRDTGELTARGVELLRRTARRQGIDVPIRYREQGRRAR